MAIIYSHANTKYDNKIRYTHAVFVYMLQKMHVLYVNAK